MLHVFRLTIVYTFITLCIILLFFTHMIISMGTFHVFVCSIIFIFGLIFGDAICYSFFCDSYFSYALMLVCMFSNKILYL